MQCLGVGGSQDSDVKKTCGKGKMCAYRGDL